MWNANLNRQKILLAEGKSFSLLKITDFMTRFKSFQILLKKGLITKRKTYICNKCLDKYKNYINGWTSDSINSNKNANNGLHEDYKMSECIINNITYIRKSTLTHLNDNMKEQLVLLVRELGKLISSNDFEDSRSSITQQHKSINILKEIGPFSWIKKEIHY